MTTAEIRALGYRVYEAINAKDIAALDELFDPQVIRHAAGETGIEGAKRALISAYETFPEQRFVVEDLLVEGDRAALRVTVHGIPLTPGQPKPIIMEIFRIENGRVAEVWGAGTLRFPES
ncbi:MAG: nuclear transport factor 2 family protein [Chloroflexi bacterium]|nr:nuclear transport factor 2 family protein [Chloroflexota bacterium]